MKASKCIIYNRYSGEQKLASFYSHYGVQSLFNSQYLKKFQASIVVREW